MAPLFDRSPTVELLTALARGSLRQDLPKAVRLWAILGSIYGEDAVMKPLPETFTYTEWRDSFFTQTQRQGNSLSEPMHECTYHQRDVIPPLHDPQCNCAKTLEQWVWASVPERQQWQESFLRFYPMISEELERLLKQDRGQNLQAHR
jgi:hypothetical protein